MNYIHTYMQTNWKHLYYSMGIPSNVLHCDKKKMSDIISREALYPNSGWASNVFNMPARWDDIHVPRTLQITSSTWKFYNIYLKEIASVANTVFNNTR